MCGIVAVISKKSFGFTLKDTNVFEQLLYADALRGIDSTGVIGADKYGDIYIDKSAQTANDFLMQYIDSPHHKDMQKDGVVLIGHNRKSTIGKITDETAHPFVVNDRFAMVHNGTLYNHELLHKTDVDSEALAIHIEGSINNDYTKEKFSDALAEVYGAYACVWYNQVEHSVQFIRNDQRPLWICEGDDSWFLASEGALLYWVLGRNGVAYKKLELIPVNTLHTLSPGYNTPLSVEVIEEKKAQPTTTGTTVVGTAMGGILTSEQHKATFELSKNKFKRLNKKLSGRRIVFFIDDYVEKNLFQQGQTALDYLIMGETDELTNYKHTVKGEININRLGYTSIDDLKDGELFSGTISHVTYDAKYKQIDLHVTDIVKVPVSIPTKKVEVIDETPVVIH